MKEFEDQNFTCQKHNFNNLITRICTFQNCQLQKLLCTNCIIDHAEHMKSVIPYNDFENKMIEIQHILQQKQLYQQDAVEKTEQFFNQISLNLQNMIYEQKKQVLNEVQKSLIPRELLNVNLFKDFQPQKLLQYSNIDWNQLLTLFNIDYFNLLNLNNNNGEKIFDLLDVNSYQIEKSQNLYYQQILQPMIQIMRKNLIRLNIKEQNIKLLKQNFEEKIQNFNFLDINDQIMKIQQTFTVLDNKMKLNLTETLKTEKSLKTENDLSIDFENQIQSLQHIKLHEDHQQMNTMPNIIENNSQIGFEDERNKEPAFLLQNSPSNVIFVKGISTKLTITSIYNLFSNFGNIVQMIYIKLKQTALIQYQTIEYAKISQHFLNNIEIYKSQFRIYFSKYQSINTSKLSENDEIFVPQPQDYRFKSTNNVQINPISSILHFSNLKQEVCDKEIFKKLCKKVNTAFIDLKFITGNLKNMAIMKFSSNEQAIQTLMQLHNTSLQGRKMIISFTKHKI